MYCINSTSKDVWFNLAAEEYLLKKTEGNYFMLWQSQPSVVVGKHQDVYREVNLDYTTQHGIQIARRYSGGGTVYHDEGNINLTFIETTRSADFETYARWIMEALSPYDLDLRTDARRGIYIGDRKISGSAQCIWKDRVLYHATLLYHSDLTRLTSSLETDPLQAIVSDDKHQIYVGSVKSPVTNIINHLSHPLSVDTFRKYLITHFLGKERGNRKYILTDEETRSINTLREEKYIQNDWNYNRLPISQIERVKTI